MQRAIVAGDFPPGSKLKIAELEERLNIGATPLREGLSRLSTLGFVEAIDQRGFRVATLSMDDLRDITIARMAVEIEAVTLSMQQGDPRWEGEIVSCLHQMQRHLDQMTSLGEDNEEFDQAHRNFHMALISACGSRRLVDMAGLLYDQAHRYRRIMLAESPMDIVHFAVEHRQLTDLVLARKIPQATTHLRQHLSSTFLFVYGSPLSAHPTKN